MEVHNVEKSYVCTVAVWTSNWSRDDSRHAEFFSIHVPAQLNSLAGNDSFQIGPALIWRGSNWVKEIQYGLDHDTTEQNELTGFFSPTSQSLESESSNYKK